MARPSQIESQRKKLLPIIARAFSDLGYRRATTAELARRCDVRENILYRIWDDKKAMFIASIRYVYDLAAGIWTVQAKKAAPGTRVKVLLDYESAHIGEFGHYRIIFAGLSETHDPEIRAAMASMYKSFHDFIRAQLEAQEERRGRPPGRGAERRSVAQNLAAWALVGLGTLATISRELKLMSAEDRRQVLREVGRMLAEG